jgi:hypothetical protein
VNLRRSSAISLLIASIWCTWAGSACAQTLDLKGKITDPQGIAVSGATVRLQSSGKLLAKTASDAEGKYAFIGISVGNYSVSAEATGFVRITRDLQFPVVNSTGDLQFRDISALTQSLVISAKSLEPEMDLRNSEVFDKTLFARDDQVFQQLDAGIDAGQHEGGGKSLEIRRFGFNLDHGGVNGGLKVLLDDVQQNQGTQGHGQGYLGALKSLSPELIQDATVINGPFSAEYGDFSGLGVVHIRQREAMPDEYTVRLQEGNFNNSRGFLAFSPNVQKVDSYLAYDGSYTDGPFVNAGQYRRDNINTNYSRAINERLKVGFRFLFGRNNFDSSGQIPLDLVNSGQLDRFGFIDPTDGGRVKLGTMSAYLSKVMRNGDTLRIDGFLGRSLFDLYSNFTFFLNDPIHGDAFQQHDSRLQQGSNTQYQHATRHGAVAATFTTGGNFHDNQINVGLYPRAGRHPMGVTTRTHAHVTNVAGYTQETLSLWQGRLIVGGGIRYDAFRYGVLDEVVSDNSGTRWAGRWQGKGNLAFTPKRHAPVTFHANYGRGINSVDARGVVQHPTAPRLATTDFYQLGTSSNFGRFGFSTDAFLIDHSNEQVYIPDDGSFEFKGPSRSYGYEAKLSVDVTRHISFNGGLTKIGNAFFRDGDHRVYIDSAPHFVANAGLTVAGWKNWSGSLRMRAINHYRLDGDDPSIVASGHTVFDLGLAKQVSHHIELSLALDNLTNRDYYETQNYFESRVTPNAPAVARIHATPGYPLTAVGGITLRLGGR